MKTFFFRFRKIFLPMPQNANISIRTLTNTIKNTNSKCPDTICQAHSRRSTDSHRLPEIQTSRQRNTNTQAKEYRHTGKEIQTHRQKIQAQRPKNKHRLKIPTYKQRNTNTHQKTHTQYKGNTSAQAKKYKHTHKKHRGKEIQTHTL